MNPSTKAPSGANDVKHKFNDRLFCTQCGVDAIGLQAWGPRAMECPFTKYAIAETGEDVTADA